MELNIRTPYVESSGQIEEETFSIEDTGAIFEILRSKMYSNNILAICREISCNARDAHREVGKEEIPIEITLPNHIEPFYKIKDFGPGISPDRMLNVFIKYTASTKRKDNLQTGGFGLGAKTPFAYSDTFNIVTYVDGIKYNYACFIDETRVGKLSLLDKIPTDEVNGTEIIIPVKTANFIDFKEWTEFSTRYWKIRPIIKGCSNFQWDEDKLILSGNRWEIRDSNNISENIKLVIDGVMYPLDYKSLDLYTDTSLIKYIQKTIFLYFNTGELTISASREQIYLDDSTKLKINKTIQEFSHELKKSIDDKIESFPSLWDANVYYRSYLEQLGCSEVIEGLSWRGIKLGLGARYLSCPVYSFHNGIKISRNYRNGINYDEESELYINDLNLKDIQIRYIKKYLQEKDIKSLQVICPNTTTTVDVLNTSIRLDLLNAKKLSSIVAAPRVIKNNTDKLLVFKLNRGCYSFNKVSYDSVKTDNNQKFIVPVTKTHRNIRTAVINNNRIDLTLLINYFNEDQSIYGLDYNLYKRKLDKFKDFCVLEDYLKSELVDINKFMLIKHAIVCHLEDYSSRFQNVDNLEMLAAKIKDPDSLYLKFINCQKELGKLDNDSNRNLLKLYEIVFNQIEEDKIEEFVKNHPEYDFKSLKVWVDSKYPLISMIGSYERRTATTAISHYINLIDQEKT